MFDDVLKLFEEMKMSNVNPMRWFRTEKREDLGWPGITIIIVIDFVIRKKLPEKLNLKQMEIHQSWRVRLSFKNATILVTILNVMAVLFLLNCFLSSSSSSSRNKLSSNQLSSVQLKYIKESEELRLAMQPLELIKRVREIQQEVYAEPETVVHKDAKQTAAVDLSKRLKDFRTANDAASIKALEEWRKRKMERARQRALERNGTTTTTTNQA